MDNRRYSVSTVINTTFYGSSIWSCKDANSAWSCTLNTAEYAEYVVFTLQCPTLPSGNEVVISWSNYVLSIDLNSTSGTLSNGIDIVGTFGLESISSTTIKGTITYSEVISLSTNSVSFQVQVDKNTPLTSDSMYPVINFYYAGYYLNNGEVFAGSDPPYNYGQISSDSSGLTNVMLSFAFPPGSDMSTEDYTIILQDSGFDTVFNFINGQLLPNTTFGALPMTISSPQTYNSAGALNGTTVQYVTITGTLDSAPVIPIADIQGTVGPTTLTSVINMQLGTTTTYTISDNSGSSIAFSTINGSDEVTFTCTLLGSTEALLSQSVIFQLNASNFDMHSSFYLVGASLPTTQTVNCTFVFDNATSGSVITITVSENAIVMTGNTSLKAVLGICQSMSFNIMGTNLDLQLLYSKNITNFPVVTYQSTNNQNFCNFNGQISSNTFDFLIGLPFNASMFESYSGIIQLNSAATFTFVGGRLNESASTFYGAQITDSNVNYSFDNLFLIQITGTLQALSAFSIENILGNINLQPFSSIVNASYSGYTSYAAYDSTNTYYFNLIESANGTAITCVFPSTSTSAFANPYSFYVYDNNQNVLLSLTTNPILVTSTPQSVPCSLYDSNGNYIRRTINIYSKNGLLVLDASSGLGQLPSSFNISLVNIASMNMNTDPLIDITPLPLNLDYAAYDVAGKPAYVGGGVYNQGSYNFETEQVSLSFAFPPNALISDVIIPDYSGTITFGRDTFTVTNGVVSSATFYKSPITNLTTSYAYDSGVNLSYIVITGTVNNPAITFSGVTGSIALQPVTSGVYATFSGSLGSDNTFSYASFSLNGWSSGSHGPYNKGSINGDQLQISFAIPYEENPNLPYSGVITMLDPNNNPITTFTIQNGSLDSANSIFYGISLTGTAKFGTYIEGSDTFYYISINATLSSNFQGTLYPPQGAVYLKQNTNVVNTHITGSAAYSISSSDKSSSCLFSPFTNSATPNISCTFPAITLPQNETVEVLIQAIDNNSNTLFAIQSNGVNISASNTASFSIQLNGVNLGTATGTISTTSEKTEIQFITSLLEDFTITPSESAQLILQIVSGINSTIPVNVNTTPSLNFTYASYTPTGYGFAGCCYGPIVYNGGSASYNNFTLSFGFGFDTDLSTLFTGLIQMGIFTSNEVAPIATFNFLKKEPDPTYPSNFYGTPIESLIFTYNVADYNGGNWLRYVTITGALSTPPTMRVAAIQGSVSL